MSDAPGTVAKAFLDALPSLDFNKLVGEARRQVGIVVAGDPELAGQIIEHLLAGGEVPADSRLRLWRHVPGEAAPKDVGKPELVIVVPGTDECAGVAREAFSGVPQIHVALGEEPPQFTTTSEHLHMHDTTQTSVQHVLVPRLVERLWDRRLAVGRGMPAARGHVTWRMTRAAARDLRILLGSVAGAGGGRNGTPTAATAQLLMHQASLIVSIAAVSGEPLDEKSAVFKRVAPNLVPTLLLDGAEAGISRLAAGSSKRGKLYGQLAAYVARPTLSISSTLLAGMSARRVFRRESHRGSFLGNTREISKKAMSGAGQGAAMAAALLASKLHFGKGRDSSHAGEVAPPEIRGDMPAGNGDAAAADSQ